MAEAAQFDDQRDMVDDEFGDIIKTRTGRISYGWKEGWIFYSLINLTRVICE